jgi:hypothetical protein
MKLDNSDTGRQVLYPGTCRRVWEPRYTDVLQPWLDVALPIPLGTDYPDRIQVPEAYPDTERLVAENGRLVASQINTPSMQDVTAGRNPTMIWLTRRKQEGSRSEHPLTGASPWANRWWWVAVQDDGVIVAAGQRHWPIPTATPAPATSS